MKHSLAAIALICAAPAAAEVSIIETTTLSNFCVEAVLRAARNEITSEQSTDAQDLFIAQNFSGADRETAGLICLAAVLGAGQAFQSTIDEMSGR